MSEMSNVFALRLKQARIQKKMSMDQLVSAIGGVVTKQAISKYESAKMMPNSTILVALATALDVTIDYFFRPFTFDIDKFDVSFRKKSCTSAKDINSLKVLIQDEVERYLEIEEILGKEKKAIQIIDSEPISTVEQMRKLAMKIRNDWSLGIDAIGNVQDVLEEHGIIVICVDAPNEFDGVSGIVNGNNFVVVLNKNQKNVERRRLTSFHEFGHLLCNNRFSSDLTIREKENLCNVFASELLLPSENIKTLFKSGDKFSVYELRQLQIVYGISIDAIMYKLKEIGIISESKYKTFCIRKNKNKHLKKFVETVCYQENFTNKFETMVYAAAAKELISISKAASLLHSTVSTVRKHLNVV